MKFSAFKNKTSILLSGSMLLLLIITGCKIRLIHEYGEGFTGTQPGYIDKIISTQDLGVGYDLVFADPEDWAKNSVQKAGVRPRVFIFEPNDNVNLFIDIPQLQGPATRRILPKGVFAETNSRFQWSDSMRFVYSATDFQKSYGGSVSASVGAPVASFSASASYQKTRASTSGDDVSFAFKDGAFRGHTLAIDTDYHHQLNPRFLKAIRELNPGNTSAFIQEWGTHYSGQATIGARCSYRLEYSRKERSNLQSEDMDFELAVSGGTGAVEVGVGAGYNQSSLQSTQNTSGAKSVHFVSYGGSGAGLDDFALWTEHAVNNPTVVDVSLEPYTSLLNKLYFPNDTSISAKRALLEQSIQQYFVDRENYMKAQQWIPAKSSKTFGYEEPDAIFDINISYLRHAMRSGTETNITYWGELKVKPFDKDFNEYAPIGGDSNRREFLRTIFNIPFWDLNRATGGDAVAWKPQTNGELYKVKISQEPERFSVIYNNIPINWRYLSTGFVSLLGSTEEFWKGKSAEKTAVDTDNRINFSEVAVGKEVTKVVEFVMDNDPMKVAVLSVQIRMKRIK